MGDIIKLSWPDRLKLDGVMCHGYGVLPKFAMCDSALPLTAKAIYAYFCSMSGSGDTAFPGRDTILSRLNISKQTYYKNLEVLKEQGYISVHSQTNALGQFSHNIYRIEENPKNFSQRQTGQSQERGGGGGTVSFQGIKGAGFGMIPRAVMMDARLDVKAKGIYAYFASFTGVGQAAFPEVKTILYHLQVNKDTYHKHLKALTAANYIIVRQRYQDGRLGINDFFLVANPDESKAGTGRAKAGGTGMDEASSGGAKAVLFTGKHQRPKKQDTVKQDTVKQDPEKQDAAKQDPEKQSPEKSDAIISSSPIPSSLTISSSDYQSYLSANPPRRAPNAPEAMDGKREDKERETNVLDMVDRSTKRELQERILEDLGIYNELFGGGRPSAQALEIQQLVSLVVDTVTVKAPAVRVGKAQRPRRDVAERLLGLTREHYLYVLQSLQKVSKNIKNPVQYRLAALYNAPATYQREESPNAWMRKYIEMRKNG